MKREEILIKEKMIIDGLKEFVVETGGESAQIKVEKTSIGENIIYEFKAGLNNEPVLAQYFFLPTMDDVAPAYYFTMLFTIADNVNDDQKKLEMLQAMNFINAITPLGNFQFDSNLEVLSYRYTVPVCDTLKDNEIKRLVYAEVLNGVGIVSRYIAILNAYLYDRIDWDEFIYAVASINDGAANE